MSMTEQGVVIKTAAEYQFQACQNLEAEFAARGDTESVRHFQQRQRALRSAAAKSSIPNRKS